MLWNEGNGEFAASAEWIHFLSVPSSSSIFIWCSSFWESLVFVFYLLVSQLLSKRQLIWRARVAPGQEVLHRMTVHGRQFFLWARFSKWIFSVAIRAVSGFTRAICAVCLLNVQTFDWWCYFYIKPFIAHIAIFLFTLVVSIFLYFCCSKLTGSINKAVCHCIVVTVGVRLVVWCRHYVRITSCSMLLCRPTERLCDGGSHQSEPRHQHVSAVITPVYFN